MAVAKKRIVKRIKTGLAGIPLEKGYESVSFYFHQQLEKKDYIPIIKDYIKSNYDKRTQRKIFSNKDYVFNFFNYAAMIYFKNAGLELPSDKVIALERYVNNLIESGVEIVEEKIEEVKAADKPKPISPLERLKNKVNETIMGDISELEDKWIEGEDATIDIYKLFKQYDLKGASASIVKKRLQKWYDGYKDAYDKTCPQMVEGYSHLTRREINKRLKACEAMINDLDKLDATRRAIRAPKVPKAKTADKQVSKLNFKQNDTTYNLESVSPAMIVGATKLFLFNTKSRKLSVYIATNTNGFEVSRSSLKNFSVEHSETMLLRKPNETLSEILKTKAVTKLSKLVDNITTKKSPANGRINNDTIILKVIR